jgi:hypothetical protein
MHIEGLLVQDIKRIGNSLATSSSLVNDPPTPG